MPKKAQDVPISIRLYQFHGVDIDWRPGLREVLGTCPFCGEDRKFSVHADGPKKGLWRCLSCNAGSVKEGKITQGGNDITFLRLLWRLGREVNADMEELAQDRKLIYSQTLADWGVTQSPITDEWMIPGYSPRGEITQLYLYRYSHVRKKHVLMATPGLDPTKPRHGLHGVFPLIGAARKEEVYIAEGPWDGMALWEVMRHRDQKLFNHSTVIAVPGCNVFFPSWLPLLAGKRVILLFDSDHPRVVKGHTILGGGTAGVRSIARMLREKGSYCKEIVCLKWGSEGYDPEKPHGYDVRDLLTESDE